MARENNGHCRLLELPAELRNRIYRYTLVQESEIRVHQGGFEGAPILQTCRQIRAEALAIYIYENTFYVDRTGCDSTLVYKLTKVIKGMGLDPLDPTKTTLNAAISIQQPNWNDLMLWFRRVHEDEISVGPPVPADLAEQNCKKVWRYTLGGMMAVVCGMPDLDWHRVEYILTAMRPSLVQLDARWAQD